jgi:hypothetical protein
MLSFDCHLISISKNNKPLDGKTEGFDLKL